VLLVVLIIPVVSYSVLRTNKVQSFLVKEITSYLSEELQTEVYIDGIDISLFLNIIIEKVFVKDLHNRPLLKAESLHLRVKNISFKNQILKLNKVVFKESKVNLQRYEDDSLMNFKFLADYFSSKDTVDREKEPWKIECTYLELKDSEFNFLDELKNEKNRKGINFSNLAISRLNLAIEILNVDHDTISGIINQLSFHERSGFKMDSLQTRFLINPLSLDLKDLKIITPESNIAMDLTFDYPSFQAYNDFINSVRIKSNVENSVIQIADIGFFAPALLRMDNKIRFRGDVKGKINNLKIKDIILEYGKATNFKGKISMNGLPDIEETFIHMSIKDLNTNKGDLENLVISDGKGRTKNLVLPEQLLQMGNVGIKGSFTGFYNSFVSYAKFYTDLGLISTDLAVTNNFELGVIEYDGMIAADNFQLGRFLSNEQTFGKLDLNANIEGSGVTDKTANFNVNCTIDSMNINGYSYNEIDIRGDYINRKFNGKINLEDPNCNLNFDGIIDFSEELPDFNFTARLDKVRLDKLNLSGNERKSELSTSIEFQFKGNTIDNLAGSMQMEYTKYIDGEKEFNLDDLLLVITQRNNGTKSLRMRSDYVDADITGTYTFMDLERSLVHFFRNYIPSYITKTEESIVDITTQDFNYQIQLKNSEAITAIFLPELFLAENTLVSGNFNSDSERILLNCHSSLIKYKENTLKNWKFEGKTSDKQLLMSTQSERLGFSDSLGINNFSIRSILYNDSLRYHLIWDNTSHTINKGNIIGYFDFFDLHKIKHWIQQSDIYYQDSIWTVNNDNYLLIDSNGLFCNNVVFSNMSQVFSLNGRFSTRSKEGLHLEFINFNLSNLDIITSIYNFDLDGIIDGEIDLIDLQQAPDFRTDLKVKDFYLNNNKLGEAYLKSYWNSKKNAIYSLLDVIYTGNTGNQIKPVHIEGYYYPYDKSNSFDMDIELINFNLITIFPYIESNVSEIIGYADGKLHLKGLNDKPELDGWIKLRTKRLIIEYLNTEYTFTDTLYFENDKIRFRDFEIGDQSFHKSYVNGEIALNYFTDFVLDLNISLDRFHCLNTAYAHNELYYGSAFGTGLVQIKGRPDDLLMKINAKSEKGTILVIPISSGGSVTESSFVSFISKDTSSVKEKETSQMSGLTLNFDLEVTPDATVQILLDPEGDIKATGKANLQLDINTLGDFNLYGDYEVEQGTFLFTLQNLIKKRFAISKGGRIKWNGDPYDALVNMTAVYKTKAPLSDLAVFALDSSANYSRRIPVNCILELSGPLFSPDIYFNIELPNSDNSTRQLFYSAIDTANDLEMNKQILSLLVLNRFTSDQRNYNFSEGIGSTSYELLSNQLSGWLSQISNDFDIGVNYRPGDEITDNELEVALSTQLFNDRVFIDGNIGVGGDQNNPNTQNTSNIVGDVNVEVKLTDDGRFRVKAFNRSNTNVYDKEYAPYTQGLGVFYRREFDHFRELFKSQKNIK